MTRVAIIGYGWVGKAYHKMFPDAVIYDEPQGYYIENYRGELPNWLDPYRIDLDYDYKGDKEKFLSAARGAVNKCDIAIVCVPTQQSSILEAETTDTEQIKNKRFKSELNMSIVEDVVSWIDTPLILIKSALQPGTVDRLVKETGKKIAVSVEMVGEGNYFVPFWKYPHGQDPTYHDFLIVGGEDETARRCADVLWQKMSPDVNIHLVSAVEAEICKLMENTWGALKVTFANVMYDICEDLGANYTKVLQAWGADGRTEKMHMRVIPGKRGWGGKCYSKDVPALASLDKSGFLRGLVECNNIHVANDQE